MNARKRYALIEEIRAAEHDGELAEWLVNHVRIKRTGSWWETLKDGLREHLLEQGSDGFLGLLTRWIFFIGLLGIAFVLVYDALEALIRFTSWLRSHLMPS